MFILYILGRLTAAVLSPKGKLKVDVRKPKKEEVEIAFTAAVEGKGLFMHKDIGVQQRMYPGNLQ